MNTTSSQILNICCGSIKIDPMILPVAIAGHGANLIASSLADSLEVNAIVFVQNDHRILLASFDLLYIGGELRRRIVEALSQLHKFREEDIFLFASHTHFAPPTDASLPALGAYDVEYAKRIERSTIELVDTLLNSDPTPTVLEVRLGEMDFGVNRRRPRFLPTYTRTHGIRMDRVTFAPNPAGARDTLATTITWRHAESDRPVAMGWNYGCHPVSHTPSGQVSADFPGVVRRKLRSATESTIPIVFMQGFCGDVRPNIPASTELEVSKRFVHKIRNWIAGTPHMDISKDAWLRWSTSLADRLAEIATSPSVTSRAPVCLSSAAHDMPLGRIFRGDLSQPTMRIQGLRIGESLEIIAFGAEPSAGWRLILERQLPAARGVRVYSSYCGDVFGYLPLPAQIPEGGYEVEQFQRLFGMHGNFQPTVLENEVADSVRTVLHLIAGTR